MYDLIIVGGGPSGISASIYARSRGLNTLLIEKNKIGGMIGKISMVTHFAGIMENESGHSFAKRMKDQAESYGLEIAYEEVVDTDLAGPEKIVKTKDKTYKAKAVIIATGTTAKKLGLENDSEFFQKGLYQNAQDDHDYYKDKTVVVVGGSDGACKEAIYLSKFAKEVHLVHHGEKLGTVQEFKTIIENSAKITVHLSSSVKAVSGDDKVNSVILENSASGQDLEIKAPDLGVFVHIGADPNTAIAKELEMEDGYFKVDNCCQTNLPGVYAVGDVRNTLVRQVSTAVADGTRAAIKANEYINSL
ncbi:MAG: NAD(P)/FAD-dependent oxidoreductase [Bacillota bacterium]|nr:NAD(P)/FAD-dependent oxidoreductase [Bacillota bacterium]